MFCRGIDNTARFFLDPSNSKFSQGKKVIAWTTTILAGIATLGLAQAVSALWRSCRHVHEKNETQDTISKIFHKIFCCSQTSEPVNRPVPGGRPPIAEEPFSYSDLSAFLTAVKYTLNNDLKLNQRKYRMQYDAIKQAICIQEVGKKNRIVIGITSEGHISSVHINNVLQTEKPTKIPEMWAPITRAFFKKALEDSSDYCTTFGPINISVVRKGLKNIPEYHLSKLTEKLTESIVGYNNQTMRVYFLDNENGVDLGGLSRDYLDDLAEGIIMSPAQNFKMLSGLAIPQAKQNVSPEQLALLDQDESSIYEDLGILMMYCFHSESEDEHYDTTKLLGHHFDEAIFKGALSLTAEEIETPFDELAPATLLKLSHAILKEKQDSGQDVAYLQQWFSILNEFDNLSDAKLVEAAQTLAFASVLPQKFQVPEQEDTPDMVAIKKNLSEFKEFFRCFVFSQETSFGQIGKMLAPIHAIAKGMKSICHRGFGRAENIHHWDTTTRNIDYQAFSEKVQGSLDPSIIARQIHSFSPLDEFNKKVRWLKEWIIEEATQDELKAFLKFSTGTSALLKGKTIGISHQARPYLPVPKAHTCSFTLELAPEPSQYEFYNDHTKEGFIKTLKELALNVTGYQMS
jgi:hypothetical protein